MATEIVIASAARTPIGSFNGTFGAVPAHDGGGRAPDRLVHRDASSHAPARARLPRTTLAA